MNLQEIQKRLEELSAEMLTLSNDLSAIVSGSGVSRGNVEVQLSNFKQVEIGDVLTFSGRFTSIDGDVLQAGQYVVTDVETTKYVGNWSVQILTQDNSVWINFNQIAMSQVVSKAGA